MSKLSDIVQHFNELNRDNSSKIPVEIYGKREANLRRDIREYNFDNNTNIALIQPVQFVRKFTLRGL